MRNRPFTVLLLALAPLFGCGERSGALTDRREAAASTRSDDGALNVLVGYYSLTGKTEMLAGGVAEGVGRVADITVTTKKVSEITREDLAAAEGLVLGAPTHFANLPGQMKVIIDDWSWKMKVDFTDKVGGAFATGGHPTGGKEHVVVSLLLYMLNNRMILVGPLYGTDTSKAGKMGVTATTGSRDAGIDDEELEDARKLGERVAQVVKRLHAREE